MAERAQQWLEAGSFFSWVPSEPLRRSDSLSIFHAEFGDPEAPLLLMVMELTLLTAVEGRVMVAVVPATAVTTPFRLSVPAATVTVLFDACVDTARPVRMPFGRTTGV